ncbi:MAG: hypothetical protein M1812_003668 [Candelaria pacifica]|nr:MAG: hypothetical protein M1812_003668 [Candelaria pacifica]
MAHTSRSGDTQSSTENPEQLNNGPCDNCGIITTQKCSGCRRALFCSKICQKEAWQDHIFDCSNGRPIDTADLLYRACRDGRPPQDEQTNKDFGFDKVWNLTELKNLMGLYYGILIVLRVSTRRVRKWQLNNRLAEHIKLEYETKSPENGRPGYFSWFLANEKVVDQSVLASSFPGVWERGWQAIGGSDTKSRPEIKKAIESWPERKRESFIFYMFLLSGNLPQPDDILWLHFGFCVCRGEQEELRLAKLYLLLVERCTFEEFWLSFNSVVLPGLFLNKELSQDLEEFRHLKVHLSLSPNSMHSVWLLKQLIYTEHNEATKAVSEDYGFANCGNTKEFMELKKAYKRLFDYPKMDEMELDRARLADRIYEYVRGVIETEPKFERLMKNGYPLGEDQSREETDSS